jgi:hypothetical protein
MAKKSKVVKKSLSKEEKESLKNFEAYLVNLSKEILGDPSKNIEVDGHIVKIVVKEDFSIEFVSYSNVEGQPLDKQRLLSKAETFNLLIKGAKIHYDQD